MFMTLRCGRDDGDGIRCLEATHRPVRTGPNISPSACNSCRAKKLGCSRDLAGCRRCRSRGIKCVYPTERSKAKKSPPQIDARVNLAQAEISHPPLPPISNSFEPPSSVLAERATDLPSSSSASACRPAPTTNEKGHDPRKQNQTSISQDNQRSRSPIYQAGSSGVSCATINQHSADGDGDGDDDDMVVLGRPDLTTLLSGEQLDASEDFSDKYLSTTGDDLFPSLLDTFGDSHDNIGPDRVFGKQCFAPTPPAVTPHAPNAARTLPWLIDFTEETNGLGFDDLGANPLQLPSVQRAEVHNPSPRVGPTTASGRDRAAPTDVSFRTTTVDMVDGDDCECTCSALRVLEQVAVPWKGTDLETAERRLCFLKGILSQCFILAHCGSCPQDSGFAMLILILYEKIASIFEEVARAWKWYLERLAQHHGTSQQLCMWLGKYQIDTVEEHCQVLATLITIQLRRLVSLVAVAKRSVVGSKWEAQLKLLTTVNQKIHSLQVILNS